MPDARILFAMDREWWREHRGVPDFRGERWTRSPHAARDYGLEFVASEPGYGLSRNPRLILENDNSGGAAINWAVLAGAWRIILLGFDCRRGRDGKQHWFGEHRAKNLQKLCPMKQWLQAFRRIAEAAALVPVEIINCSPDTAIDAFPRMPLDRALKLRMMRT